MVKPKLISFYFPQFHSFPENDHWWGKDFTDWKLVKDAQPLYNSHTQPRKPIDGMYYNPCDIETLIKQSNLAKKYGVGGFMFYHYWFEGKLLLEKPMETLLANKGIDMPFCICWANETWTRTWVGKPQDILIEQKHSVNKQNWLDHFNYLLPFLKDDRYIKKDNKPIIIIYKPNLIKGSDKMLSFWRELAIENGLDGLYIIANKNHTYTTDHFLKSYDGLLKFQPREAHTSKYYHKKSTLDKFQFMRVLPNRVIRLLQSWRHKLKSYEIVDSTLIWDIIIDRAYINEYSSYDLDYYESGFFHWDNTPRYKNKARIFTDLTKDEKVHYLTKLKDKAIQNDSEFIFWNAWNEWSEGSYLEPDNIHGFENLEVIKRVLY